jgi:hypothetical protein
MLTRFVDLYFLLETVSTRSRLNLHYLRLPSDGCKQTEQKAGLTFVYNWRKTHSEIVQLFVQFGCGTDDG